MELLVVALLIAFVVLVPIDLSLRSSNKNYKRFINELHKRERITDKERHLLRISEKIEANPMIVEFNKSKRAGQMANQQTMPDSANTPSAKSQEATSTSNTVDGTSETNAIDRDIAMKQREEEYRARKAEKARRRKELFTPSNILLAIGAAFIIVAGIVFCSAIWADVADIVKVGIMGIAAAVFFGFAFVFKRRLNLSGTSASFYYLGTGFVVIMMILVGEFAVFGKWFSFGGAGKMLVLALMFAFVAALFVFGSKVYSQKIMGILALYASLMSTLLFVTQLVRIVWDVVFPTAPFSREPVCLAFAICGVLFSAVYALCKDLLADMFGSLKAVRIGIFAFRAYFAYCTLELLGTSYFMEFSYPKLMVATLLILLAENIVYLAYKKSTFYKVLNAVLVAALYIVVISTFMIKIPYTTRLFCDFVLAAALFFAYFFITQIKSKVAEFTFSSFALISLCGLVVAPPGASEVLFYSLVMVASIIQGAIYFLGAKLSSDSISKNIHKALFGIPAVLFAICVSALITLVVKQPIDISMLVLLLAFISLIFVYTFVKDLKSDWLASVCVALSALVFLLGDVFFAFHFAFEIVGLFVLIGIMVWKVLYGTRIESFVSAVVAGVTLFFWGDPFVGALHYYIATSLLGALVFVVELLCQGKIGRISDNTNCNNKLVDMIVNMSWISSGYLLANMLLFTNFHYIEGASALLEIVIFFTLLVISGWLLFEGGKFASYAAAVLGSVLITVWSIDRASNIVEYGELFSTAIAIVSALIAIVIGLVRLNRLSVRVGKVLYEIAAVIIGFISLLLLEFSVYAPDEPFNLFVDLLPYIFASIAFVLVLISSATSLTNLHAVFCGLLVAIALVDRISVSVALLLGIVLVVTYVLLSRFFFGDKLVSNTTLFGKNRLPSFQVDIFNLNILSCLVLFSILNKHFDFMIYLTLAVFFANIIRSGHKKLTNTIFTVLACISLAIALAVRPFLSFSNEMITWKITVALIALLGLIVDLLWKRFKLDKYANNISSFIYIAAYCVLIFDALAVQTLMNTIIVLVVSLAILVLSFVIKQKRWFLISSAGLLGLTIYITNLFLNDIEWWIYLLVVGAILIAIAATNEYLKTKGESVRGKTTRFFDDWKW